MRGAKKVNELEFVKRKTTANGKAMVADIDFVQRS